MLTAGPRTRALYLLAVAIGVFLLPALWMVAAVAGAQVALWLWAGLGGRPLVRQLQKLGLLVAVILLAYSLSASDPRQDIWHPVTLFGVTIELNLSGAALGLAMALRIVAVVLASHVARAGDPQAIAAGLGALGAPRSFAVAVDTVLAVLGRNPGAGRGRGNGSGGGRRRGNGSGGGRRRGGATPGRDDHARAETSGGFWQNLWRLARGDMGFLAARMRRAIADAEDHVAGQAPGLSPAARRDIAVIAGVAVTMLGIKVLKLLPGIPFAPGHKGVLLIPLYIAAGVLTKSRFGATLTGAAMGTVAFLSGDGRYGVFEIAKHIAPGLVIDALMPFLRGAELARRGRRLALWMLVGLLAALGRYATITAIALVVQAPALVYAVLVPGLIAHALFGALSGLVTGSLIAALMREPPSESSPSGSGTGVSSL